MTTSDRNETIKDRAHNEALQALQYFENMEALGSFAGQDVKEQKLSYLTKAFVNFVQRESSFHKDEAPPPLDDRGTTWRSW